MKQLIEQIKTLNSKLYTLKTKKAVQNTQDKIRDLETQLFPLLEQELNKFQAKTIEGTVLWFDVSGDVSVSTEYGDMFLSNCSDVEAKSWYPETCCITYQKGQSIKIDVHFEIDFDRYCIKIVSGKTYGGTVDLNEYDRLSQNPDLAFFKYPGSTGVTGLFK
jgi:hypothetical protein